MTVNGRNVMDATHSEVVRMAHSGSDVLELEVATTCNVLAPQIGRTGTKESAVEAPICSGYLWRKAATSTSPNKWVRRWFALRRNNCLYYYKTDSVRLSFNKRQMSFYYSSTHIKYFKPCKNFVMAPVRARSVCLERKNPQSKRISMEVPRISWGYRHFGTVEYFVQDILK